MSVAIVIPDSWEPSKLVHWSTTIARAKGQDLLIIRVKRQTSSPIHKKSNRNLDSVKSPLAAAIRDHAGDFAVMNLDDDQVEPHTAKTNLRDTDDDQPSIFLKQLSDAVLFEDVLKEIKALRVKLLIVPRHAGVRMSEDEFAAQRQLLLEAPCETLQLRPGKKIGDGCHSILVATSSGKRTTPAIHFGEELAGSKEGKVTALNVTPITVATTRSVRRRFVGRFARRSSRKTAGPATSAAVVDRDFGRTVGSYATIEGHDLVVVDAADPSVANPQVPAALSEKHLAEIEEPTVAVVRSAIPLTGRFLKLVERRKQTCVPQLDRQGRVDLVERLRSCANWDFDFVFLICVATLIAALGLWVSSPPVVIGAMLVAPLMSPMLGVGLSVVQGNRLMANTCLTTIRRGFLVAFLTGMAVGVIRILFASGVTPEMATRGAPGVLDLGVAFFSGVVAAYVFGRPHLLSVLPGIAIATSLIPPVATAGLALCVFELEVALGATLLFLSNFVAIVLGSAFSLWFVGMRASNVNCPFTTWARRWVLGFSFVAVTLAVYFTVKPDGSQVHAKTFADEEAQHAPR